eukprot:TRINITY_DN2905_c0_g1_i1.p1 TRINITY_DN2905_c0_g1~~TRINITY_DN2905_c0_g1_i1.p1  ORF type:complete len:374 (-),score=52.53 TRINITY_DN2905_c0_g1_i1:371-1492(-)
MDSLRSVGMLVMVLQGLMMTGQIISGELMKRAEWPFYRVFGVAHLAAMLVFALIAVGVQAPLPERRAVKWMILRGLGSLCSFIAMSTAVRLGAPAGDVAALTSVNTVIAALMGRAFLGEALQRLHVLALLFSMAGALLISKPSFLFGSGDGSGSGHVLAYLLALAGGFSLSCVAIAARKASKTSVWIFNLSPCAACTFAFLCLPLTPAMDDATMQPLLDKPEQGLAWLLLLTVLSVGTIGLNTAGSMWCPAAVSATLSSASRILFGYLADVVIFGKGISPTSLGGAGLMLCGVVVMALVRAPPRPAGASSPKAPTSPACSADTATAEDENESLASFIAAEFATKDGHEAEALRQRRHSDMSSAAAVTLGALAI